MNVSSLYVKIFNQLFYLIMRFIDLLSSRDTHHGPIFQGIL